MVLSFRGILSDLSFLLKISFPSSHYHNECLEQYQEYKDTCPPNWIIEHQYLNVQAGTVQGNQLILNCENIVLCKFWGFS